MDLLSASSSSISASSSRSVASSSHVPYEQHRCPQSLSVGPKMKEQSPVRQHPQESVALQQYIAFEDGFGVSVLGEGSVFEIPVRYRPIQLIGKGAYGIVCSAKDTSLQREVAIKKIENAFEHRTYMKRTLRELRLLRCLRHKNLIRMHSILKPRRSDCFKDLYIATELMETDLSSIIRSEQPLTNEHTRFFIYQILRGVKFLHSAGIMHRDLKPRNLLVNSNCDLKICDFGLARLEHFGGSKSPSHMSDYVATRWYRAPEILLSWKHYSRAVDIWSIGCILAELLTRQPLFPGQDTFHQIKLVLDVVGTPGEDDTYSNASSESRDMISGLGYRRRVDISSLFPGVDPGACDLLDQLLQFDPEKRLTVNQALKHPYMRPLHCEEDEPCCDSLPSHEFEFENEDQCKKSLMKHIANEVSLFHPGTEFQGLSEKRYLQANMFDANPFTNPPKPAPPRRHSF